MKKNIKTFYMGALAVAMLTGGLAFFYNDAFMPSFMLMLSLFLFGVCYAIKDEKKSLMYLLFILGVLLIIGSLVYTYIRLS